MKKEKTEFLPDIFVCTEMELRLIALGDGAIIRS
jgi:hypothetical protein